jgi:hypothetical protein
MALTDQTISVDVCCFHGYLLRLKGSEVESYYFDFNLLFHVQKDERDKA